MEIPEYRSDEILSGLSEEDSKPYNIRHRCFYFSKEVILFVKDFEYENVFSSLFNQLVRSATSIGANVIEGKAGSTKKDWQNYYSIALKSANETKYWLCLIRDTITVQKDRVNELIEEANEISKIIASVIINSKESKK
ncbi:four helix bundle protein [Pinibacter soli]|uniref:Four helix bundle protein n=1 Tax=Pinibacter soli TaxID=3044211 RepID=A0ABT6R8F3_9BACT|nr:four helix bundle protein [Pinibacter soli]MDI3318179.1 four helix bundle protein [Pinibacter soli]